MHRTHDGLSVLLLPVTAALLWIALGLPQRASTGFVLRGDRVEEVAPGGPADRAGIAVGDRLLPSDPSAVWARSTSGLTAGLEPGRATVLTLLRQNRPTSVRLVPEALPRADFRLLAILLMVACGFLLLASVVWSERRDALTRGFFLLSLAFAVLVAPLPQWRSPSAALGYEALYTGITLFLPALFIHFFVLFPESERPTGALGAVVTAAYAFATLLYAALVAPLALPAELRPDVEPFVTAIESASALWFALGVLAAAGLFVRSFRATRDRDARRRLRVALAGTVLGVAPLAAVVLMRSFAPGTPVPGERVAVVATLLVPASFAWAIVVHRIFDVRVALRAVAFVGALALGGVLTLVASDRVAELRGRAMADRVSAGALVVMAIGAALAGSAVAWLRPRAIGPLVPVRAPAGGAAGDAGSGEVPPAVAPRTLEDLLATTCRRIADDLRLAGCAALDLTGPRPRLLAATHGMAPVIGPAFGTVWRGSRGVTAIDQVDLEAADRDALEDVGVRWLLPVGDAPVRAVLLLGRRLAGAWLGTHEQRELERFAAHLDVAVENFELRRTASTHVAYDRELREARSIQTRFLPRRIPVYPTLDCAAAAHSCEAVGGDYYDFIETGGRDFTLAVGDAAGHGVPAALLLAGVQARFRHDARQGLGPSALLGALNRQLVQLETPEKFVGLLCARVDVRHGRIGFANAGLTPPLVRRADGRFEEVRDGGVLLGVRADAVYRDAWRDLGRGDVAVVYTDGLTEAQRGDELFGVERVQDVLDAHAGRRASEILAALITAVRGFADRPLDDLTVVVLKQLTDPPAWSGARAA